jgi:nitroimidazol reductase NimA-like FMN-containing flavoprotein (pyridoxamine 5'-phosphate oxidase superfamily)
VTTDLVKAPLLAGFRDAPPLDVAALTDVLHRVARLAADLPLIAELDINPPILYPSGCTAVDGSLDSALDGISARAWKCYRKARPRQPPRRPTREVGPKVLTDRLKVMGTATPGGTRVRNGTLRPRLERSATMADRVIEELERDECLRLIAAGGVGRIAYTSRFGPAVLPVNYTLYEGAILFRTAQHSPLDEDLRTGITNADYKVAFEIDDIDMGAGQGWSVLVQGPAHHVTGAEREAALNAGVEAWAPGDRELFVRIVPSRITGRRISAARGARPVRPSGMS